MNQDDYVSYELAVKLKDAGFDEPCDHYYDIEDASDGCYWEGDSLHKKNHNEDIPKFSAPTLWQAQKWLREKKGVFTWVMPDRHPIDDDFFNDEFTGEWWWDISSSEREILEDTYPSYESALSAGISAALELINENKGQLCKSKK